MDSLLPLGLFIFCLVVIELIFSGLKNLRSGGSKSVQARLQALQKDRPEHIDIHILRDRRLSQSGWLHAILSILPGMKDIDRLLQQANVGMTLSTFLLLMAGCAACGYLIPAAVMKRPELGPVFAMLFLTVPLLYVLQKKNERIKKFADQLPDALELIGRTMRAGHAFSGGMKMVAEEFEDPIGTEFARTLSEINFGVGVADALKAMAKRVGSDDLNYFVIAVIIQRETGGNLAEIVEAIALIIRERIKLMGKVRVLAAEGKFSAIVLCALPFLIALFGFSTNPKLFNVLTEDPAGRMMSYTALGLMAFGVLVIRKMIKIRV